MSKQKTHNSFCSGNSSFSVSNPTSTDVIITPTSHTTTISSFHSFPSLTLSHHPLHVFYQQVHQLAISLNFIHPNDTLELTPCKEGLTNLLFLVTTPSSFSFLVRLYGAHTSDFIDRDQEIHHFQFLAQHHLAPPLYATFQNGLVYGYIDGQPCTPDDIRMPSISESIALQLRQWHSLPIPNISQSELFKTMHKWLNLIKSSTLTHVVQPLEFALKRLELRLPSSKLVFAHNDLLSGNILKLKDKSVRFIDYEYGGVGYAAFDIANHFCEWAGFDCDWSHLPTPSQQQAFLKIYLGPSSPLEQVESMYNEVQPYFLASHLFWCLWGYLQSTTEKEITFDYYAYAQKRWEGFLNWEQTLFMKSEENNDELQFTAAE